MLNVICFILLYLLTTFFLSLSISVLVVAYILLFPGILECEKYDMSNILTPLYFILKFSAYGAGSIVAGIAFVNLIKLVT